ncbi:MAG: hypothetical protein HY429_00845 [Candidatus Levybacteria bacterium]|nr:hypothetical protein [Candidatus Levybacteria bacterium]
MSIPRNTLFIKQEAILEVIEEHQLVNFKTIQKNFFGTNERTLRYHIKKLIDAGFVRKHGTTKGAHYEAVSNE